MLKIGIDGRSLGSDKKSGVENYVENLILDLPTRNSQIKFYIFVDSRSNAELIKSLEAKAFEVIRFPVKNRGIFNIILKFWVQFLKLDLFHFPVGLVPNSFKIPSIITVYDLTSEIYPEFYQQDDLKTQKEVLKNSTSRAEAILAISESTKRDLIGFYKINQDKIFVTPLKIRKNIESTESKRLFDFPYIFSLGNIQPRKNFVRTVQAFSKLKSKNLHFVIGGKIEDAAEYKKLLDEIDALGLKEKVHILDFVPEKDLESLYKNCLFFCFPSLYEGFGYPIVEAFFFGAPVLTSNISSMPEIAADAAVYVDPSSSDSIKEGMEKLLSDQELRDALIKKGKTRLNLINKKTLGEETIEVYKKVLEKINK